MIITKLKILIVFGFSFYSLISFGQDGHYWGNQYGTTSNLLSGAVIGSVNDLGAVYYNPGFLSKIKNPSFLLSTKAYQLETLKFEDALGNNRDLRDRNIGSSPELIAFSFEFPSLPKHRFALSIVNRLQREFNILTRTEGIKNSTIPPSGDDIINGEIRITTDVKEDWFGFSWSFKISDKISFGISNFFIYRSKSDLFNVRFQALNSSNSAVIFNRYREFDIKNIGLLWKGGVSYDLDPVSLGLVITTPRINFSGNGSYLYEDFFLGIEGENGEINNVYANNYQDGLDADFRSPWAIGLGAGINLKKTIIHFSIEWYSKVREYTLLDPEPFYRQSDNKLLDVKVIDDLDAVINYGVGVEVKLKENVSIYGSFSTDFSAVKTDAISFLESKDITNNSATNTDFFHFSAGSSLNIKKIELIFGLGFSFGSQVLPRPLNLPNDDNEPIFDSSTTSKLLLSRWQIIFGFSIPFLTNSDDIN